MLDELLLLSALVAAAPAVTAGDLPLMSAADAMALPQPAAELRLSYATHPQGFADLRVPPGPGPHPVAIVIHGGCWLAEYDLGYMASLAAAITGEGFATWTIEYRRVGDAGGGWPGTFEDVAAAADHLRTMASAHRLDLGRTIAVGHSAGGHLALWLAARHRLAPDDPLRGTSPLPLAGVLSLAGIPDLAAYAAPEGCGAAVPLLLGGDPPDQPERLARTSPCELLPLGVPQILLAGELDSIVPIVNATRYAAAGRTDAIEVRVIPDVGHFELISPTSDAWPELQRALVSLLGRE